SRQPVRGGPPPRGRLPGSLHRRSDSLGGGRGFARGRAGGSAGALRSAGDPGPGGLPPVRAFLRLRAGPDPGEPTAGMVFHPGDGGSFPSEPDRDRVARRVRGRGQAAGPGGSGGSPALPPSDPAGGSPASAPDLLSLGIG